MKGQWIGEYGGDISGAVMVNIDESDTGFEAVAYVNPSTNEVPATVAYLDILSNVPEQSVKAYLNPVDPRNGYQCKWVDIRNLYPEGVVHSETADVKLRLTDGKLHVEALSDIGVVFNCVLERPPETDGSRVVGDKMSWTEFKNYVSGISKSRYLFRGQTKPWRLCSTFHRRGRFRISEFTRKDIPQLHQRLCAITTHFFDLTRPDQNGAFFSLLQHHGYPTPLLDWSHSPYVAAFFAFRDRPIGYVGSEDVRIYVFDNMEWIRRFPQIQNADPPFPHLSVMEFIAIGNPRLVLQQAVTTVTNIHDIEAYLLAKETETGVRFIRAMDIPASERETAMRDLRFMGITAGSMFPGIDGVCEEMRERNFSR